MELGSQRQANGESFSMFKRIHSGRFFLALLLFSIVLSLAGNSSSQNFKVIWSATLTNDSDWKEAKTNIDTNGYGSPHVEFVGNDKVVVSFLHANHQDDPGAQPGSPQYLGFKAIFHDAKTGKSLSALRWTARRAGAKLFPLHDGGFLVRDGDKLLRYSSELKVVRERTLPGTTVAPMYFPTSWDVDIAPGGRIAVLRYVDSPAKQKTDTWINVDTFDEIFSMKDNVWRPVHVAEDALARTENWLEQKQWKYELYLRERGKEWKPLARDKWDRMFITNDLLLVGVKGGFQVVNREGMIEMEAENDDRHLSFAKTSLASHRFALFDMKSAFPIIQKRDFFDERFTAKVFDWDKKAMVASISFGTHDSRQVDLAISPDGSRLAVLTESTLQLIELPPP